MSARPVILDTDIGSDIDDAYALALILASPELRLVGVTIGAGRTDQRAPLALKLLHLAGRDDVPVAVGRRTDGGGEVNQAPWAEGYAATAPCPQTAAEFLVHEINAAPGEITLVAVGPFTNLGDALKLDPDLGRKVGDLVIMGGCVGWPEGATPEIRPEYNVVVDVPASQALFACGAPLTVAPLDATMRVPLEAQSRAQLADRQTPLTNSLVELLKLWPGETPILHDPLAVGMVLEPELCGTANLNLTVDDEGYTRVADGPANCRVAITPQAGRFLKLFMSRVLAHDPSQEHGGAR